MKNIKVVTLENLQQYHNILMKHLSNPHLVPINICPQCNAIIDDTQICKYCGVKLKLVIDKGGE